MTDPTGSELDRLWSGFGALQAVVDRQQARLAAARIEVQAIDLVHSDTTPEPWLLDPDCRDGKHASCVGAPCECPCHLTDDVRGDCTRCDACTHTERPCTDCLTAAYQPDRKDNR